MGVRDPAGEPNARARGRTTHASNGNIDEGRDGTDSGTATSLGGYPADVASDASPEGCEDEQMRDAVGVMRGPAGGERRAIARLLHYHPGQRPPSPGELAAVVRTVDPTYSTDAEITGVKKSRASHVIMRCNWRGGIIEGRCFDHTPKVIGVTG